MNVFKMIYLSPLVILPLSGCTIVKTTDTQANKVSNGVTSSGNQVTDYQYALSAAEYPNASKVSKGLVPLIKANKKLKFNTQGQVLMTSFTKAQYYGDSYVKGYQFELYGESWLTAAPYLQEFCQAYSGQDLLLRTQQLLGLPPKTEAHNDSVVSLWVSPNDIFRPCADPETVDQECAVTLSGEVFVDAQASWKTAPQPAKNTVEVSSDHLTWLSNNWYARFSPTELYSRYPWTALGYTYDWGNLANPVGMSEFVSLAKTPVVFESIESLESYCGRQN